MEERTKERKTRKMMQKRNNYRKVNERKEGIKRGLKIT